MISRSALKELFRFTRRERIASIILLALTVAATGLLFRAGHDRPASPEDFRRFDSLIRAITPGKDSIAIPAGAGGRKAEGGNIPERGKIVLSTHDPNRMNEKDWQQLGLPRHLILTIKHYLNAGGKFRKTEDLKKIYGLSDSWYNRISGYLEVPAPEKDTAEQKTSTGNIRQKHDLSGSQTGDPVTKLEINRADSAAFVKLPGIYPVLARRIVRYRTLLGGFVKKDQLLEVYGLHEDIFRELAGRITVNPALVKKININRCREKTLAKHPYLTSFEAKSILFYRSQCRHIDSAGLLLKNNVIPEKTFRKISPYLTVREK